MENQLRGMDQGRRCRSMVHGGLILIPLRGSNMGHRSWIRWPRMDRDATVAAIGNATGWCSGEVTGSSLKQCSSGQELAVSGRGRGGDNGEVGSALIGDGEAFWQQCDSSGGSVVESFDEGALGSGASEVDRGAGAGTIRVLGVPFIGAGEDRRGVVGPVTVGFNAINSIEGGGKVKRGLRRGTEG
jgi:hypothetical protein